MHDPRAALCLFALVALAPRSARADKVSCAAAADQASVLRKDVARLTHARDLLRTCIAEGCDTDIRDDCRRWLEEVELNLPTLVFAAEDEAGQPLPTVKVLLDGALLLVALDGKPVAVDAGQHTFTFVRDGAAPVEVKTLVRAGKKNAEVLARFPGPARVVSVPTAQRSAPPPSAAPEPARSSLLGPIGLGAAGLGAVALGIGSYFGIRAFVQKADANCPDNRCRPQDIPKHEEAVATARVSTVFFVTGAALAATGLTLVLLSPRGARAPARSVRVSPVFDATGAGLMLQGDAF